MTIQLIKGYRRRVKGKMVVVGRLGIPSIRRRRRRSSTKLAQQTKSGPFWHVSLRNENGELLGTKFIRIKKKEKDKKG